MLKLTRTLSSALLLAAVLSPRGGWAQNTPDIPMPPPPPPASDEPEAGLEDQPAEGSDREQAPATEAAALEQTTASTTLSPAEPRGGNRNLRLAPTPIGETGLVRVAAAEGDRPGVIRLGLGLDFFSTSDFIQAGDSASRFGAQIAISGSPTNYLELWLSMRGQSVDNSFTSPTLLQTLGDVALGAKGFYPVSPVFSLGADLQLGFLSGVGESSFDLSATVVQIRALATADLAKTPSQAPVRLHLNFGVVVDGSDELVSEAIGNAERFALGISDYHRLVAGLAVEVPVRYVTPYLEYSLEIPVSPGYLATPGVILSASGLSPAQAATGPVPPASSASDPALPAVQRVIPQRITPGVRITAIPDLTLDLAVEIGITPDIGPGVLAVPPYNVIAQASYAFDPFHDRAPQGPPVAVPVLVPTAPPTGTIAGQITSQEDGKALEGAVISFDRGPPVATDGEGRFISHDLAAGPIKVFVRKDGFIGSSLDAAVVEGSEESLSFQLVPEARNGLLKGKIADTNGRPIPSASIQLTGPRTFTVQAEQDGGFELELKEGEYALVVAADKHFRAGKAVTIKPDAIAEAAIALRQKPKDLLADVAGETIGLARPIEFAGSSTELPAAAAPTLDAVVDLILGHSEINKVVVESHIDKLGEDAEEMRITKGRADAIASYLIEHGVPKHRVEAVGMGATRPLAPNLTPRGRAANRRIELRAVQ